MVRKIEKKEWYKRWWAIVIYVLIGFVIFFIILGSLIPDSVLQEIEEENKEIQSSQPQPEPKELEIEVEQPIQESLTQLHSKLFGSTVTKEQRKQIWEQYEGKLVEWEAYVKQVDDSWTASHEVLGLINPPSKYEISADVGLDIKDPEGANLAQYSIGDKIRFRGRLESYGTIVGEIIYVEDVEILEKLGSSPPSDTNIPGIDPNAGYSNEELLASCIASGIPKESCRNAIYGYEG